MSSCNYRRELLNRALAIRTEVTAGKQKQTKKIGTDLNKNPDLTLSRVSHWLNPAGSQDPRLPTDEGYKAQLPRTQNRIKKVQTRSREVNGHVQNLNIIQFHLVFQSVCTNSYSHQQCTRDQIDPNLLPYLVSLDL